MIARQRGAALLTALIIVSVVATVAAGMVWQQWRAVQVETAERSRTQSAWILSASLDFARLFLREDLRIDNQKKKSIDSLDEIWATPLAEARLTTFLAAEAQVSEDAPDAFISGSIVDAQSKFNLGMLVDANRTLNPVWNAALGRLCEFIGVSPTVATRIANGLLASYGPAAGASGPLAAEDGAPLRPETIEQLAWFGIEPEAIRALEPYVILLPKDAKTTVNVNTASREVIAAVIAGSNLAAAERIVQVRQRKPMESTADVSSLLGGNLPPNALDTCGVKSDWFEVLGRARLGSAVLEQRSLVERKSLRDIRVVRRERISSVEAALSQPAEK